MCDEEGERGREVRKHQEKAEVKMMSVLVWLWGRGMGQLVKGVDGEGGRRMEGIEVKMSLQS